MLVSKEKSKDKKKKHTNNPNDVSHVVWARFRHLDILFYFRFAYIVD